MAAPHVPRYHALDALRAAMMLLGLVLHSGVSYVDKPIPVWPYHDPATSLFFDLLVAFIHLFRMPVFFIAAGFFSALLWERDGRTGFVTNRLQRVALPLAIAWPLVYPAIIACTLFSLGQLTGATQWSYLTSGQFLGQAQLMHLWFLYYLLIYYAVMALALPLVARIPARVKGGVLDAFERVATRWWGLPVLALATAITLVPMTLVAIDTGVTFLPAARVLVAYGVFFTFGLMLFVRRDVLARFGRGWPWSLALGVCVSGLYLMLMVADPTGGTWPRRLVMCAVAGLSVWLLIAGILGFFLAHLDVERPVVRYLSDAAYWMYIVHLPFTLLIPGLLANSGLTALARFAIVLSGTVIVSLVSYHFLVRSTMVGHLLNGRRYPVRLPLRATAQA